MKKAGLVLFALIIVLGIVYFSGPSPDPPEYGMTMPVVPERDKLASFVREMESTHKIKTGNEAEIVWADTSAKDLTDYAVVYLHGFSASKTEGDPVHNNFAKKLRANLFLSRLADHGIDTIAPMEYFTTDRLWESGKQALAIGEKLGKKVILMGTSTGGTLALQLAAAYPEKVHSLVLLSPNIAINDKTAFIVNDPWGLQIARKVIGGQERVLEGRSDEYKKYWYTHYRLESVVQLEELIETSMNKKTFSRVKQPVLMLYYYKNEQEQDPVVRVDAMLKMFDELGTPAGKKFKQAMPNAGNHVLGSYVTSKDIAGVEKAILRFLTIIN